MVATYNFGSVYRHEIRVALFPDRAVSRRDAPSEVACLATCKLINSKLFNENAHTLINLRVYKDRSGSAISI